MLAAVIGVFVLLVSLLLVPAVRNGVLSLAVSRATSSLPGDLTVRQASWAALGSFEMADILWTADEDTLLAVQRFTINANLNALLSKDIRIDEVIVQGLTVNLPAIEQRSSRDNETPTAEESSRRGFPRDGAIAGIPSIAVGRVVVETGSVRINNDVEIDNVSLDASLDISAGASPRFSIAKLLARTRDGSWSVDSLSLILDLGEGQLAGGGHGTLGPGRQIDLDIQSSAPDSVDIKLAPRDSTMDATGPGLVIRIGFERHGITLEAVHFTAEVQTTSRSNLSRMPAIGSRLDPVPEFDRITIGSSGTVRLEPRFTAQATCRLGVKPWLDEGRANIHYENGELSIEDLALASYDVSIAGSTHIRKDSTRADLRLAVKGARTLGMIAPEFGVPDGLTANISATVDVENKTRTAAVRIDANGQSKGFVIDDLFLDANLSLQENARSTATIIAEAKGFSIGVATTIDHGEETSVTLSPILFSAGPIDRARSYGVPNADSQIRYEHSSRDLSVEDVRIRGGAGNFVVNVRVDSTMSGTYNIACRLPQPPPILTRALSIESRTLDSLRALWTTGDSYDFDVSGELTGGETKTIHAVAGFTLPGPATLAPLFPDSVRLDNLGPLRGSITLDALLMEDGPQVSVSGNLDGTEWIDSSIFEINRSGSTVTVDTVGISVPAASIGVRGTMISEDLDLVADLSVIDSSFVRRFYPMAPEVRVDANARITGRRTDPLVTVSLAADVRHDAFSAPHITSRISHSSDRTRIELETPGGLATSIATLDSLKIEYESIENGATLPARVRVRTSGKGVSFSQSCVIDTTAGIRINVEALRLSVVEKDLVASRPFALIVQNDGLSIEKLDLAGSLGMVQASGSLGGSAGSFVCDANISLPEEPASLEIPEHLWPKRLELHAQATQNAIDGRVRLEGFSLAHGLRSTLAIEVETVSDTLFAHLAIADTINTLLDARLSIPALVTTYPPAITVRNGRVGFDAGFNDYPSAIYFLRDNIEIPEEEVSRISGQIHIDGTTAAPTGHATATISFPDWPKLSVYQLGLEARLGAGNPVNSPLLERVVRELPDGISNRLVVGCELKEGADEVLFGALGYPLQISLQPYRVDVTDGERLHAILRSKDLPLGRFDPVLPTDLSLKGLCTIDVTVDGPTDDPALKGQIIGSGLEVSIAEQASVAADGTISIGGTTRKPQIDGNIDVTRGLIQIPEKRQDLHPTKGDARLLADTLMARSGSDTPADSTAAGGTDAPNGADIDVAIRIPERFYVRGRGLDMELGGDLHLKNDGVQPVVTGELRALHGTLVLLGRSLRLDRGTVNFVGGDEINPELDASLQTYVNNVRIYIILAGTAQEPVIILGSEPEMNDGDIISTLLFGSAYDDLSDDQADLVERRSAEMVAALGAAQLQKNLSGIDVVQFQGADSQDRAGTLTFGKFLSPDVLLSYVYAIDDQALSFVSLEYFLRGNFKLDTVYGRRNQTGLGFGWARDY